jgi:DNA-nicking Smr family endonuclease
MKRRDPTQGEIQLWEQAMREVVPVKRRRRKVPVQAGAGPQAKQSHVSSPGPAKTPGLSGEQRVERHKPAAVDRLDGSTLRRLSEGKVQPEAKIDLHGLTQVQAHARLVTFIHRAHDGGLRCVLVITGKGSASAGQHGDATNWMHDGTRGLLRSLVPRWLAEGELKRHVTGVAEAHVRHGGGGALYVYLKRVRARSDVLLKR